MARPEIAGWPLEFRGNAESREMITGPGNGVSQNPAYRPSPAFIVESSSCNIKHCAKQGVTEPTIVKAHR